jgi:hypothetical protein
MDKKNQKGYLGEISVILVGNRPSFSQKEGKYNAQP